MANSLVGNKDHGIMSSNILDDNNINKESLAETLSRSEMNDVKSSPESNYQDSISPDISNGLDICEENCISPNTRYSDRNLIINYIPSNVNDSTLTALFSEVGSVKNCRIIRDKNTQQSFGFGFCEYHNPQNAQKAIECFNGYKFFDKTLKVAFARLSGQESKNCNLFIQNLPPDVDQREISQVFGQFGTIVQCRLILDNKGVSRRICFVLYENRSCAVAARDALNDKPWQYNISPYNFDKFKNSLSETGSVNTSDQLGRQHSNLKLKIQFAAENSIKCRNLNPNIITSTVHASSAYLPHKTTNASSGFSNNSLGFSSTPGSNGLMPSGNGSNNYWVGSGIVPPVNSNQPSLLFSSSALSNYMYLGGQAQSQPLFKPQSNGTSIPLNPSHPYQQLPSQQASSQLIFAQQSPLTIATLAHLQNSGQGVLLRNYMLQQQQHQNVQPLQLHTHSQQANIGNGFSNLSANNSNNMNIPSNSLNMPTSGPPYIVYAYNIGNNMSEERLRELFECFGPVRKVDVPRESGNSSRSKNYGFVTFDDFVSALSAIQALNYHMFDNRLLQVSFRKEKLAPTLNSTCAAATGNITSNNNNSALQAELGDTSRKLISNST